MLTSTAVTLVNESLVFPVGWKVTATDHTDRFEGSILVHIVLTDARKSEREEAPEYKVPIPNGARSAFPVYVADVSGIEDLTFEIIQAMSEAYVHELREFVRVAPTFWAPFHPHKGDGIRRWAEKTGGDPKRDYLFGLG
jgi:hypothetical protein